MVIWVAMYSSFGQNPKELEWFGFAPVRDALSYWWGQQTIKRIGGPWYYYVPELVLYEPLITFPALAAVLGAVAAEAGARPLHALLRRLGRGHALHLRLGAGEGALAAGSAAAAADHPLGAAGSAG